MAGAFSADAVSDAVAFAPALVLADADADAITRLRVHCLSAAAGIRDECGHVLLHQASVSGNSNGNDNGDGDGDGDGDGRREKRAGTNCAADLAGCGEPLVHLLSRQAARLLALYERLPPPPSLPPVGSEQPAGHTYKDEDEAREPGAVRSGQEDDTHAAGGGHGGPLILKRLDDLISVAYSRFYAYLYRDLPLCWRQLYTDASILKFIYLFLSSIHPRPASPLRQEDPDGCGAAGSPATGMSARDASTPDTQLDEMVKTLDLALILAGAGGHTRGRRWIDTAFDLLEDVWTAAVDTTATTTATATTASPAAKRPKLEGHRPARPQNWQSRPSFSAHEPLTPPVRHPIRRVPADTMDMAAFQRHLDAPGGPCAGPEPLVLAGLADGWPARAERPWDRPSYLVARTFGGRRLVPVEVGRSYVDEGWGQKIVTFGEFLAGYIDPSSSPSRPTEDVPDGAPVGRDEQEKEDENKDKDEDKKPVAYLAQHQLFLQLPQLCRDVLIPDHCYTAPPSHPTDPSQDQPELEAPLLNAWLGPPGTITPLHTDPYHNLLAQVVGRKYVRLYSPHQTGRMRARGKEGGVEMSNTSLLDVGVVEGWDVVEPPHAAKDEDGDGGDTGAAIEEFKKVPFVDCILEPGDVLYIPIGWWHYVRGLSVSFSVSLWWN